MIMMISNLHHHGGTLVLSSTLGDTGLADADLGLAAGSALSLAVGVDPVATRNGDGGALGGHSLHSAALGGALLGGPLLGNSLHGPLGGSLRSLTGC